MNWNTLLLTYIIILLCDIKDTHKKNISGNTRTVETTQVKIPKPPEVK